MNIDDIKNLPKANNLPAFYRDIIMCWVKTGEGQLPSSKYFANIRKQLIWGNKYIKVKGKSLLFNNWINSNLILLKANHFFPNLLKYFIAMTFQLAKLLFVNLDTHEVFNDLR
jgi:hypothetical protein